MKLLPISNRPVATISSHAPQTCVFLGKILLLFTTLLVAAMPVTEYLWTFDKFLRGGQDCEFGLLALATILSLVLVLCHQRREFLQFFLSLRRLFSSLFNPADPAPSKSRLTELERSTPIPRVSLLALSLPLQI